MTHLETQTQMYEGVNPNQQLLVLPMMIDGPP